MKKLLNSGAGTVIALGVVGVTVYFLAKKEISDGANALGDAVSPLNDENIFNQGVLSVGRELTGNKHWTLGGWIYDITH